MRDSQVDSIIRALLATGYYARVEQDLSWRRGDSYAKQVPRFHDTRSGSGKQGNYINLWTESVYKLRVDNTELLPVPDIQAQNAYLVDERFAGVPKTMQLTLDANQALGINTVPRVRSSSKAVSIYIPSLPNICDAIIDQWSYGQSHAEDFPEYSDYRPKYHLQNLIRYLHLETPSQRQLLLSMLAERNVSMMTELINRYKRKWTWSDTSKPSSLR